MSKVMRGNKKKRIGDITALVFFVIGVLFFVFSLYTKKQGSTISLFGKETRLVLSDSMSKCEDFDDSEFEIKSFSAGESVIIDKCPINKGQDNYYIELNNWVKENVHNGDVLTFSYKLANNEVIVITHRVISISVYEDGYCIVLQGDNRVNGEFVGTQSIYTNSNNTYHFNYLIGKVTNVSHALGLFTRIITSKVTLIILVIIPCLGIIIYETIYLIIFLDKDKKQKELLEKAKKDEEIERLKKQLEELKKENS